MRGSTAWRCIIRHDVCLDSLRVYMMRYIDGKRQYIKPMPLVMDSIQEEDTSYYMPEPTFEFSGHDMCHEFLQSLAEGLVEAGYKPDELKATNKELAAKDAHLQDMRRLVGARYLDDETKGW